MDVTKPYKFKGFGAMDVTKPYEFIRFGAMDVPTPYEFIGFGAGALYKPPASNPNPIEGRRCLCYKAWHQGLILEGRRPTKPVSNPFKTFYKNLIENLLKTPLKPYTNLIKPYTNPIKALLP